jgi:hypothetical protein
MTGPGLSPHERQILAQIEHDLRQADEVLDRGLRTMRPVRWWRAERLTGPVRRLTAGAVVILALTALALTSVAVHVHSAAATGSMAVAAWAVTALALAVKIASHHNHREGP